MSFKKLTIAVLGSTGSIGISTLKIIKQHQNYFNVELLSCDKNKKLILNQIDIFSPRYVIINNTKVYNEIKKIKFSKKILFFNTLDEFKKKNILEYDKVVLGISSIHGLEYAFLFLSFSKEILVANKETIVCGGNFFINLAKKKKCIIQSIDSEHYCLESFISKINIKDIERVYLTASGGPFLKKNFIDIAKASPEKALKHPRWKMGKKITIDSATMANKCLEIMEASILFNLDPDKIKIKIHEESKVHAIIILKNNMVYLVAHNTSMLIPIKNSLFNKNHSFLKDNFFISKDFFSFSFDEKNLKKFNILSSGYKALKLGHRACIFFNVVNDFLVDLYLNKKIFFYEISNILNKVINNKFLYKYFKKKITNKDDIYETINYAQKIAKKLISN